MLNEEDLKKIRVEFGQAFEQLVIPQLERMDEKIENISHDIKEMRLEISSLRCDIEVLSNRDKEDSDAFAREILNMKRRIDALEERVNRKETAAVAA